MGALNSLLNTYGGNADNMSPTQEAGNMRVLEQAMRTYNTPTPSYSGQTVAPMTPELEQSHTLLQRLNHDFQDENRGERDSLASNLLNRDNVGTRAINNLSETFNPQEQHFDAETKRAIKRARNEVAASNVQRGTFGSQSHQAQTEDAIRRLLAGRFGGRSNLLNNSLRGSLSNMNNQDGSDINRLNNLGRQGLNEYQDALGSIQSLNNQGTTNWFNNQHQLNGQQQDFENEQNSEWPHLQGNSNSTNPHLSGITGLGGINYALSNPVHSPLASINPQALNANAPLAPFNQNELAPTAQLKPIDNSAELRKAMEESQRRAQEESARRQQQEAQRRAQEESARRKQQEAQKPVSSGFNLNKSKAQLYEEHKARQIQNRHMAFNALPRLYKDSMLLKWTGGYPNTGPDPVAANYKQYMTYAPQMGENPNDSNSWRTYSQTHW